MASPTWDFVAALPAVPLQTAIEAGDTVIVPHTDARYGHLIASDRFIRQYLARFRTAFGVQLRPSVVLRQANAPAWQVGELPALRNIVAVATVVNARIQRCIHNFGGMGPLFSDLFEFYPVNVRRDGRGLIVETASRELGIGPGLRGFRGQPHPAYVFPENVVPEPDETLLKSLTRLWLTRVRRGKRAAFRRRVFRSLELS